MAVQSAAVEGAREFDALMRLVGPGSRTSEYARTRHRHELAWYVDHSEGELGYTGSTIYSQLCGGSVVVSSAGDELTGLERERLMRAASRERPIRRAVSKLSVHQQHVLLLGVTRSYVRRLSWLDQWFGHGRGLLCAYLAGSVGIDKPKAAQIAELKLRANSEFGSAFEAYLAAAKGEDFDFA